MSNKIPVCEDCSNLQIKAYKECMCKKILDLIGAYIGCLLYTSDAADDYSLV